MRILVDKALWGADTLFFDLGDVRTFEGRSLMAADLAWADALVIRSVTRVGPDLLKDTAVRFVGSATSGEDHLDVPGLQSAGVHVVTAAGCNSRAVVEYVLACLLILARRHSFHLQDKVVGIVGVGRIGGLLAQWCQLLGIRTMLCDPPRARVEVGTPFHSIDEVFRAADIVTLHVPLTRGGPDATADLVDDSIISACKDGLFLINTSRGEVVVEDALIRGLRVGRIGGAVIDVWRGEPTINHDLCNLATISTPHIAGYTVDSRARASRMIHDALRSWRLGAPAPGESNAHSAEWNHSQRFPRDFPAWERLSVAVGGACDVITMNGSLRALMAGGRDGESFDSLRRQSASRREFSSFQRLTAGAGPSEAQVYAALGFTSDV